MAAEPSRPELIGSHIMREADECGEVQMTTNAGSFVRRPWSLFDDLLGEGVPQEHIDLLLEMRRLERERLRENAHAGKAR